MHFKNDCWTVLNTIEKLIKNKIENAGILLKNWDIKINYGIKTGFNEAFIINEEKRKEILLKSPKAAEIIRPILRGRDIKRYNAEWAGLYIISTFPSLKINIDDYPVVKEHLLSFGYDRLKQTGDFGARKKTHNEWFEMQDSINYWEDFDKQKIVWAEIARTGNAFTLDKNGYMVGNTGYILVLNNEKESNNVYENLLTFLNSKAILFYLDMISTRLDETGWRWLKQYVDLLPIPKLSESQLVEISEEIQNELVEITVVGQNKIDSFVNKIFGFTQEEILFLDKLHSAKFKFDSSQ